MLHIYLLKNLILKFLSISAVGLSQSKGGKEEQLNVNKETKFFSKQVSRKKLEINMLADESHAVSFPR